MNLSLVRRLFGLDKPAAGRPRLRCRVRLNLEMLENRLTPSTLHVGSSETYHTIQSAVLAANPGDTIKVDSGTYLEQVMIDQNSHGVTLNNLDLEGNNQNSIIELPSTAPATQTTAIVEIKAAQNVTINKFTVEGPGNGPSGSIGYGIEVDGGASANITNDHVTHIRDNPLSGDQNGTGILVGGDVRRSTASTGTATISQDTIDNYQKRGIEVGDAGSSAEIDHTTVTGVGPTAAIAQNGIEPVLGATANVNHDTISGNIYTGGGGATGILLYQSGAVTVDQNMLSQNDVGIYVLGPTGRATIEQNQIAGSTDDGIDLDGVSGAYLSQNQIANSGVNGIALFDDSMGNDLEQNQSKNNGNDGIFVDVGSTGNTFNQSQLQNNGKLDAEDDTTGTGTDGTGNTWTQNHGKTSNPHGLVS